MAEINRQHVEKVDTPEAQQKPEKQSEKPDFDRKAAETDLSKERLDSSKSKNDGAEDCTKPDASYDKKDDNIEANDLKSETLKESSKEITGEKSKSGDSKQSPETQDLMAEKLEGSLKDNQDFDKSLPKENRGFQESDHWEKMGEFCKNAYENASANPEKTEKGNDYKALTPQEKEQLSNVLKDHINSIPDGERGNYRVPEPEKIKGVEHRSDGSFRIVEAWKPNTDGTKEGTRHMEVVKAKDQNGNPTYIDRVGDNNGNYFSPMKEDGTPYELRKRAIGDFLPKKNIEENDSYHKYEVKQDFTKENFEAAIDKSYTDPNERKKQLQKLDAYYKDAASSEDTQGHDGDEYLHNSERIDGVKSGEIDNMFGTADNPDGGAPQYITPFSAKELEQMDMIKEVRKDDY